MNADLDYRTGKKVNCVDLIEVCLGLSQSWDRRLAWLTDGQQTQQRRSFSKRHLSLTWNVLRQCLGIAHEET